MSTHLSQSTHMSQSESKCQKEQASIMAGEDLNMTMETFYTKEQNQKAEANLNEYLLKMCPEVALVRGVQKFGITGKHRGISKKKKTTTGTRSTTMSSGPAVPTFLTDILGDLEAHHAHPMIQAVKGLAVDDAAAAADCGAEVEVTDDVPPEDAPIYEINMVPN